MEYVNSLETRLAKWADKTHAVACCNGTAALHLALEALQLPRPSYIACPMYCMIACPRAIAMAGHIPVFVDCDYSLNVDLDALARVTKHTRAVLIVHTYGRQVDMDKVHAMCDDNEVIEDMAELHGINPHQYTRLAAYSFYQNKILAGEEGGAVVTDSISLAYFMRTMRCQGFNAQHDFNHAPRGVNYRIANSQAKLVLDNFDQLEEHWAQRRRIEAIYNAHCPREWAMPSRSSPWVYDVRVPGLTHAQQAYIVSELNRRGIAARHGFKPAHLQQEFINAAFTGFVTNAERISREVFYMPLTPTITEEQACAYISVMIHQVREAIKHQT